MNTNVFAKLLRKSSSSIHHQAVRTQSRKLDQTLNNQPTEESINQSFAADLTLSPKLSLASLQLNDTPVKTWSPVSSFRSPVDLTRMRTSLIDEKTNQSINQTINQSISQSINQSMPVGSPKSHLLTGASDVVMDLRGENENLTNSISHMSHLLSLTFKELGQLRADNQSINQMPQSRHKSLKRPMYHDSFNYDTPADDESMCSNVKIESIDSLSRSSSHSDESSLLTLLEAASLVSEKSDLSAHQLNQLNALMQLQRRISENMPVVMESIDQSQPISKRQRVDSRQYV